MSEITLYVDGACRGNPGLGGWGAYVITAQGEHKLYGGELDTTNNRMELTAAIEGVQFCPKDIKLIIWTDSNYVKRGITEWIAGWKKKNWKDVKNPDLWKKLDAVCQNREIEWNWIKGHAGHAGNEMADQLANWGADLTAKQGGSTRAGFDTNIAESPIETVENSELKKKINNPQPTDDWLLNDPFGFDLLVETETPLEENPELGEEILAETSPSDSAHTAITPKDESDTLKTDNAFTQESSNLINHQNNQSLPSSIESNMHPQIVITPAKLDLRGPRQLILDTETTGFYYQDTDRIIEVGAIEMINRKLTGSSIHIYINPEKLVGDSESVHGISDDFLKDKPLFKEISQVLYDYLKGAEIIAHNASFDMNFLDMEFNKVGLGTLSSVCLVTDTLAMAKAKHPGQKNSLDALVKRYEVPQRDRTFHGALLDAEILSDVYLAMTGGQVAFDMDAHSNDEQSSSNSTGRRRVDIDLPVIYASEAEIDEHHKWLKDYEEKNGAPCLFAK